MDLLAARSVDHSAERWTKIAAFFFFAFAAALMIGALIRAKPAEDGGLTIGQSIAPATHATKSS